MKNLKQIILLNLLLLPSLVFAQESGFNLFGLVGNLVDVLNTTVIYLIFAFAVLFFMYHIAMYIYSGNDEGKRSESRKYMLYGIIALTVMFTTYGLIGLLAITFGINESLIGIPSFGK
jgi:hypothetical protein